MTSEFSSLIIQLPSPIVYEKRQQINSPNTWKMNQLHVGILHLSGKQIKKYTS